MIYHEVESTIVELKREIPENNQIIKTIVGFCNGYGGKLVIGVDDKGIIVGVPKEVVQTALEQINAAIYQATHPVIIPNVYTQNIDDKQLLIIAVSAGMDKPYFIKSMGPEKGTFVRIGRSTIRADENMINELKWLSRGRSFDTMPVYQATLKDLDKKKVQEYLKTRTTKKAKTPKSDVLYANYFLVNEHGSTYPTTAGILLLGKDPNFFFPEARVMCAHFSGITVDSKVIAAKECTGTLSEQFDAVLNFIVGRLNHSWEIKKMVREETLEVPEVALREVLLNALVHRNYNMTSPGKIAIFDNRIEIFSPGGFPGALTQKNLRYGFTFLRNVAICMGFRELGLIETFGLGFQKLFSSYEAMHLRVPEVIDDANFVKCILPRGITAQVRAVTVSSPDADLNAVLDLFVQAQAITIADVVKILNIPRTTAGRRLRVLIEKKHIRRVGAGRSVRYYKD